MHLHSSSTWTYSADGKNPVGLVDTFNSDNGVIAMKALNALATSGVWVDSTNFEGTAAVVDGVWASANAAGVYGDYMKATKLPTFTVDGQTYQTGSFSGYKLIGCKPQSDEKKAEICNALALYLTSEEAQLERYYEFGWGPSNKAAQKNQDVQSDPLLAALLAQNAYSVAQGVIPNDWWTEAVALYTACAEVGITEDGIRELLATYEEKVNAMIVK